MNKSGIYVKRYEPIRKRNKKTINVAAKLMLGFILLYAIALIISAFN